MLKRAATLLAINIAVFCAAAEVLSLIVFYYQHGWLFYVDPYRPVIAAIPETQQGALSTIGLHPYFGPTHAPGIPFDVPPELRRGAAADGTTPRVATNNFGFAAPFDYPYARRNAQEFLIGLFGGSVGLWFCEVGAERLVADLQQAPAFRGRTPVTLCFSHEGYKQPQQLQLLSYFLALGQTFDAVVNVDGFNEVALSTLNDQRGADISMPSSVHLDPLVNLVDQATLTPEKLEVLAEIGRDKRRLNALAERVNRARSAAMYFVLDRYYAVVNARYRAALLEFDRLPSNPPARSLIRVTPPVQPRSGDALYAEIAAEWVRASTLMHDMLAARRVPYVHVLQPNQYFTTARTMTAAEAATARSDESPFKAAVERGYPVLVAQARSGAFARAGIRFVDGTTMFDDVAQPVYIDNCCHYTLAGNDRLADVVARTILAAVPAAVAAP